MAQVLSAIPKRGRSECGRTTRKCAQKSAKASPQKCANASPLNGDTRGQLLERFCVQNANNQVWNNQVQELQILPFSKRKPLLKHYLSFQGSGREQQAKEASRLVEKVSIFNASALAPFQVCWSAWLFFAQGLLRQEKGGLHIFWWGWVGLPCEGVGVQKVR